jgi:putative endonuclease
MFTVYGLISDRCDRLYVGFTTNLEIRMASHNDFGRGFTSRCRPWRCFYQEHFDDKALAMKREKELKSFKGRAFFRGQLLKGFFNLKNL